MTGPDIQSDSDGGLDPITPLSSPSKHPSIVQDTANKMVNESACRTPVRRKPWYGHVTLLVSCFLLASVKSVLNANSWTVVGGLANDDTDGYSQTTTIDLAPTYGSVIYVICSSKATGDTPRITAYNRYGQSKTTANSPASTTSNMRYLCASKNDILVQGSETNGVNVYQVQVSVTTRDFTFTHSLTTSGSSSVFGSVRDSTSSYIYVAVANSFITSFDTNTNSFTGLGPQLTNVVTHPANYVTLIDFDASFLTYISTSQFTTVSKVSKTETFNFNWAVATGVYPGTAVLDPARPVFHMGCSDLVTYFYSIIIASEVPVHPNRGYVIMGLINWGPPWVWTSILSLSPFNLLVMTATTGADRMVIVKRDTHQLLVDFTTGLNVGIRKASLLAGDRIQTLSPSYRYDSLFFAASKVTGGGTTLMPIQLDITTCQTWTSLSPGSTNCLSCDTTDRLTFLSQTFRTQCSPYEEIPAGKGLIIGSSLLALCTDQNCQNCRNDHTYCVLCNPGYYLYGSICLQDNLEVPKGWGTSIDGLDGFGMCSTNTPNCMLCPSDCMVCERCNPGYGLEAGVCVDLTTLAPDAAKGLNPQTYLIEACTEPSCVSCRQNNSYCDMCYANYQVMYLGKCIDYWKLPPGLGRLQINTPTNHTIAVSCYDPNCYNCSYILATSWPTMKCFECTTNPNNQTFKYNGNCLYPFQLPNGAGADYSTKTWLACSSSDCLDCALNYTQCRICKSGLTPQKYLYNNQCIPISSFPPSYGPSLTSLVALPCTATHCLSCQSDYSYCDVCDMTTTPPYYAFSGQCVSPYSLPSGAGADTATGRAAYCASAYCDYCQENYAVCTACKSNNSPARYLYAGDCVLPAALPDGLGGKPFFTYSAVPCLNPNCLRCQNNYATGCSACKPGTSPQTYFYVSDCYTADKLVDGYGARSGTFTADPCSSVGCRQCQQDYTVCTSCYNSYYLHLGACYTIAAIPAGYGAASNNQALACSDPKCLLCTNDYTVCTRCSVSPTTYYLHSANSSCLLVTSIPAGYGAGLSGGYGITSACTVPQCLSCQGNYAACWACSNNWPRFWVHSNVCTLEPNLPDGWGGNPTTNITQTCSDAHCLQCRSDYQVCTKCVTGSWYLHAGTCMTPATLPDGYGPDAASQLALPCADAGCLKCQADYHVCSQCQPIGIEPTYLLNSRCYLEYDLPLGYGADNVTFHGVPCLNTLCGNCSRDPNDCQSCADTLPETFLHFDGSIHQCLEAYQIPDGYGSESFNHITLPCSASDCIRCASNYAVCTACSTSVSPVKYLYQGSCREYQQIPDPYGANILTRVATRCHDDKCDSCKHDYRHCDLCSRVDPVSYSLGNSGVCYAPNDIPQGWGPELSTFELKTCKDSSCRICDEDYTICKLCNSSLGVLYLLDGKCYHASDIPAGYGLDNSTLSVKPCHGLGCASCHDDFSRCVRCVDAPSHPNITNPKYYLIDGVCDPCSSQPLFVIDYTCRRLCSDSSCIIQLASQRFSKPRRQLKAQFSEAIILNASAPLKLRLEAPSNGINRDLEPQEYEISVINDVMLITLTIHETEVRGSIILDRVRDEENPIRSKVGSLAFFDYPIKWDNIYLLTSSAQRSLAGVADPTAASTASAKAIAQLVLITKSSNIAKIPDMMVSNMIYLQLMNGETYLYPSIVFDFFTNTYVPFVTLTNPFDPGLRDGNCLVSPKMFQAEIDCGILPNYGIDVLIIYGTLAINIVLSLVHYAAYGAKLLALKKLKDKEKVAAMEKSWKYKVSDFIANNYGMKMILVKLDGTYVEVLFYSALTLSSQSISSVTYFYSFAVALSMVAYYILSSYFYVKLLLTIRPGLEKIRKMETARKEEMGGSYVPRKMDHYVDFTRLKWGTLGYQLEDFRADVDFRHTFAPLVWLLRGMLVILMTIGGTNMKSGQYFTLMLIEAVYLWYLVKSRVKASKYENWLSYFNEACQIAYVLLQTISYYSDDADFKQKQIGLAQAVVLVAIMGLNIGYTFVVFFWQVLIKPIVNQCKKKKEAEPSDRLKEEEMQGIEGSQDHKPEEAPAKIEKVHVSAFRSALQTGFQRMQPKFFDDPLPEPRQETAAFLQPPVRSSKQANDLPNVSIDENLPSESHMPNSAKEAAGVNRPRVYQEGTSTMETKPNLLSVHSTTNLNQPAKLMSQGSFTMLRRRRTNKQRQFTDNIFGSIK